MENQYLAHHGVKGMKWGVRKDPQKGTGNIRKQGSSDYIGTRRDFKKGRAQKVAKGYSREQMAVDNAMRGSRYVKKINKKMNAGQTYKKAAWSTFGEDIVKGTLLSTAIIGGLTVAEAMLRK